MTLEKTKEAFCPRFLLGFPAPLSSRNYLWLPSNCKEFWEGQGEGGEGGGGRGVTCNGIVSHPGGVAILVVVSYSRSRYKH